MKKIFIKTIGGSIIASLLIIPMISVKALAVGTANAPVPASFEKLKHAEEARIQQIKKDTEMKLQTLKAAEEARLKQIRASTTLKVLEKRATSTGVRVDNKIIHTSSTVNKLENRENNIEKVLARIASTTASTTAKKVERLNAQLEKQREQMAQVKDRLMRKEGTVAATLEKLAKKISDRINIIAGRGLDMTVASAKLAEANSTIAEISVEAGKIATAVQTTITDANKVQIFQDVKASQDKIRELANGAKSLLTDTIKEINNVLTASARASSTVPIINQ